MTDELIVKEESEVIRRAIPRENRGNNKNSQYGRSTSSQRPHQFNNQSSREPVRQHWQVQANATKQETRPSTPPRPSTPTRHRPATPPLPKTSAPECWTCARQGRPADHDWRNCKANLKEKEELRGKGGPRAVPDGGGKGKGKGNRESKDGKGGKGGQH